MYNCFGIDMSSESYVQQCELRAETTDENGEVEVRVMVTYLEADRVKPGYFVSLKDFDPTIYWKVITVGQKQKRSDIKRGWGMTDYFRKAGERGEL